MTFGGTMCGSSQRGDIDSGDLVDSGDRLSHRRPDGSIGAKEADRILVRGVVAFRVYWLLALNSSLQRRKVFGNQEALQAR